MRSKHPQVYFCDPMNSPITARLECTCFIMDKPKQYSLNFSPQANNTDRRSPVRYELGFYIPFFIVRRENLKSYVALTGWAL
jgi:hypothetical protein